MKKPLQLAGALGHGPADKRIEILRRVDAAGSISQAARAAGVSYKAAWQALDALSNMAGAVLVERTVGGSGGGGAHLTQAGRQLLRAAGEFAQAREQVAAQWAGTGGSAPPWAALALRTSMRNQLPCVVQAVRGSGAVRLVELSLPGGATLAARITRESAQLLALYPGQPVLALCKATGVEMDVHDKPAVGSANCLRGLVLRAGRSAGGEVAIELAGGLRLVGFARPGVIAKVGHEAVAHLDETAVVIALTE